MAIDDNTSYELTGYQVKDLAGRIRLKADASAIPTVNDATLTIQHNGSNVQTFTANQSANATANIETIYSVDVSTTQAIDWTLLLNKFHPVGSIYMTATLSTVAAVEDALGGTWVAWGAGRVPVGVDASDTDFDTAEETGGEKTHTLQPSETPERSFYVGHISSADNCYGAIKNVTHGRYQASGTYLQQGQPAGSNAASHSYTFGGGGAHNNLQPYITCYMYKRTA